MMLHLNKPISLVSTNSKKDVFLTNHPHYTFASLETRALYWLTIHGVRTGKVTNLVITLADKDGSTTQARDEKARLRRDFRNLLFSPGDGTTLEAKAAQLSGILSDAKDKIKANPKLVLLSERVFTLHQLIEWDENSAAMTYEWNSAQQSLVSILMSQNPASEDSNQEPPPPYESTAPPGNGI